MFLEDMVEYQRDRVTFGVFQKLVVKLYKALLFKLSNQKDKLEWQLILIADCLRIIGLCRLAYRMASKVHTSTSSVKNKFWSTHVSGMALQYSGDMIGAEKAFLKSQDFACELSLSFSLQHLGKLNVEVGNYKLAEQQFIEALVIREKLKRADPKSGRIPPELEHLSYREVVVNPCRIFYKQDGDKVFILFVMRAERDLRKFLLSKQ
ncbi:type II toxin-antitoxin system RelE/ParE family toxin [Vibrio parahaemolyticus]|nr:type II toxin-antitoxin system RelE/ParE family toxin [Vibrio parahaemolyticus]